MKEKETIPMSQEQLDALNSHIEEGLSDMKAYKYEDGHKVMQELIKKYST